MKKIVKILRFFCLSTLMLGWDQLDAAPKVIHVQCQEGSNNNNLMEA